MWKLLARMLSCVRMMMNEKRLRINELGLEIRDWRIEKTGLVLQ
jgi:hypothetical protein